MALPLRFVYLTRAYLVTKAAVVHATTLQVATIPCQIHLKALSVEMETIFIKKAKENAYHCDLKLHHCYSFYLI